MAECDRSSKSPRLVSKSFGLEHAFATLSPSLTLSHALSRCSSHAALRTNICSAKDPTAAQVERDTARGSWDTWDRELRTRYYLDLTNRLQCAGLVGSHELRAGVSYSTYVHARLDFQLFAPLPPAIATEWRLAAEAVPTTPRLFKPYGDDHGGIIEYFAMGNAAGMAVENGVRDAITAGLMPYNTRSQSIGAGAGNGAVRGFASRLAYPEQMSSGLFHSVPGLRVKRAEWPMCRVESIGGSCRYPGEVSRLLNLHNDVVRANAQTICGLTATYRPMVISKGCCSQGADATASLTRVGASTAAADGQAAEGQEEPSCRFTDAEWRGVDSCVVDWKDPGCCRVVSKCNELLEAAVDSHAGSTTAEPIASAPVASEAAQALSSTDALTNEQVGDAFLAASPYERRRTTANETGYDFGQLQEYYRDPGWWDSSNFTEWDFQDYLLHTWHPGQPRGASCAHLRRFGNDGDGGKMVCDAKAVLERQADDCLVVSVGSNGDVSFEEAMRAFNPACEVHIYEPAMTPKMAATIPTWAKLYAEPFDGATVDKPEYANRSIAILKIDCEGCEFDAMRPWLERSCTDLVLAEVHGCLGQSHMSVEHRMRRFHTLMSAAEAAGFKVFSSEVNLLAPSPTCIEYGLTRSSVCPARAPRVPD